MAANSVVYVIDYQLAIIRVISMNKFDEDNKSPSSRHHEYYGNHTETRNRYKIFFLGPQEEYLMLIMITEYEWIIEVYWAENSLWTILSNEKSEIAVENQPQSRRPSNHLNRSKHSTDKFGPGLLSPIQKRSSQGLPNKEMLTKKIPLFPTKLIPAMSRDVGLWLRNKTIVKRMEATQFSSSKNIVAVQFDGDLCFLIKASYAKNCWQEFNQ